MIAKCFWTSLLSILLVQGSVSGMQSPESGAEQAGKENKGKEDPLSRFHWLETDGAARGAVYQNRQLANLKVGAPMLPSEEIETEVARPDANSMQITRRVYDTGVNGNRQLVEVVVENLRLASGDRMSATRTVSRRDANGTLQLQRKEVQETAPAGPGKYRTQTSTLVSNGAGSLVPSLEIVQVESGNSQGRIDIDKTTREPDANGSWKTVDRRISTTRPEGDAILIQEDAYRQDVNGKLVPTRRESGREWTDAQGRVNQETETYNANAAGKLELNARSTIVRIPYSDGSVQETQTLYQISPADPSSGLKLTEKVVSTVRPEGPDASQKELEVQAPDLNGNLQVVTYQRVVEKK